MFIFYILLHAFLATLYNSTFNFSFSTFNITHSACDIGDFLSTNSEWEPHAFYIQVFTFNNVDYSFDILNFSGL